jgi:hypothetical protein
MFNSLSDYNEYLIEKGFIYIEEFGWCRKRAIIDLQYNVNFIKVIVMRKVYKKKELIVEINVVKLKHFKKIINRIITSKYLTKNKILGMKKKKRKYSPKDAIYHCYPGSFESGR